MNATRSALRIVNGTINDLKTLQPTWDRQQPDTATCPSCHKTKPLRKFFVQRTGTNLRLQGWVRTQRCSACVQGNRK